MHDDVHDTEQPWQVSDEAIAWLAEAQEKNPVPPGCGESMLSVTAFFMLLASVFSLAISGLSFWWGALGVAGLGWFVWLIRRDGGWRRTFQPQRHGTERLRIQAPGAPRSPTLIYSFMRGTNKDQRAMRWRAKSRRGSTPSRPVGWR